MFNLMNKRLNKKGFTLIELIVVIAIIAILAVILIPRFTGFTDNANQKAAMSDARNIALAANAIRMQQTTAENITVGDIVKYTGLTFTGTVGGSAFTAGGTAVVVAAAADDFTYVYTASNGKTYTVTITDFNVQPDVAVATPG